MNRASATEAILEPDLPIIDPHHHLWFRPEPFLDALEQQQQLMVRLLLPTIHRHARYLFDEFLAASRTAHNIRATLYRAVHEMYRARGPEAMQSLSEVELPNGVAAMPARG